MDPPSEPHVGREACALLARGPGGALDEAYFDYIYAPVRDAEGNVEGVFVHGFEVTELVHGRQRFEAIAADNMRLYVETQRMNAELERQRRMFISTTAHDLRTPLAAIRASSQLAGRHLDRRGADAMTDVRRVLGSIEASAIRMAALIDELFDISRIDAAGQLALDRSRVELRKLLERVIAEQQPTTTRHALRLVCEVDQVVGHWDEGRLERCLHNLLTNAIKFSPDGGEIRVVLAEERHAPDQTWAVVSVEDHGIGIASDDRDRSFRRFERGRNVGEISGTGIGLAYVREIVTQLGGSVAVASTPGTGSAFTIRLPAGSA